MGSLGLFYSLIQARVTNAWLRHPYRVMAIASVLNVAFFALLYFARDNSIISICFVLLYFAALPILVPLGKWLNSLTGGRITPFEETPEGKEWRRENSLRTLEKIAARKEAQEQQDSPPS